MGFLCYNLYMKIRAFVSNVYQDSDELEISFELLTNKGEPYGKMKPDSTFPPRGGAHQKEFLSAVERYATVTVKNNANQNTSKFLLLQPGCEVVLEVENTVPSDSKDVSAVIWYSDKDEYVSEEYPVDITVVRFLPQQGMFLDIDKIRPDSLHDLLPRHRQLPFLCDSIEYLFAKMEKEGGDAPDEEVVDLFGAIKAFDRDPSVLKKIMDEKYFKDGKEADEYEPYLGVLYGVAINLIVWKQPPSFSMPIIRNLISGNYYDDEIESLYTRNIEDAMISPWLRKSSKYNAQEENKFDERIKKILVEEGVGTISGLAFESVDLKGKNIVFTGEIPFISRSDATKIAEALGATVSSSVSKNTDLVIVGERVGQTKMKKATDLNIATMTAERFSDIVSECVESMMLNTEVGVGGAQSKNMLNASGGISGSRGSGVFL